MTAPDRLGPQARGVGLTADPCAVSTCRRAATTGKLCPADLAKLGDMLAQIGDDLGRLTTTPTAAGWAPDQTRGGGLASHRSPARLDVLALTDVRTARDHDTRSLSIPAVLGEWADTVREARALAIPTVTRVQRRGGRLVRTATRGPYNPAVDRATLTAHLEWVARQDWIGDLWDDVRAVWAALKAATGQRSGRPVRACPRPADGGQRCGGPVYAQKGAAWCAQCGHGWTGFELVRLADGEGTAA